MACLISNRLVLVLSFFVVSCLGLSEDQCPPTGLSYMPYYSDCTLYYQCYNGQKSLMSCPAGYAWSIVINACRDKSLVDCSYTTIDPPDNGNHSCPDNGLTYLPHYGDCTKYYRCLMGSETLMSCPEGFAWSIPLAACDLRQFVDCGYTTLAPVTPTRPTAPTNPTSSPDFTCPFPSPGATFHPHPYDCSKFFECINGVKYTLQCPDGYYFSMILERCELQSYVDCSYTSVSPTAPTTPTPTTTPTTYHPTNPTAQPTPTHAPGDRCSYYPTGTFLPHPTDCTKYVECAYGRELEMDCPAGTTWDQDLLTCDNNPDNCHHLFRRLPAH